LIRASDNFRDSGNTSTGRLRATKNYEDPAFHYKDLQGIAAHDFFEWKANQVSKNFTDLPNIKNPSKK
jgi:hypothetical protein